MYLTSPTWAKSLTILGPKMQDFKRVLDLNCKVKGWLNILIFSVGFSNVKNLVLSNGFEQVQIVIPKALK